MLDTRTMIVMLVFSTLVSSLLMWLTQRRQQIGQGILVWATSYVVFSVSLAQMATRDVTPTLLSILLPNLLNFTAVGLMTEAVRQALELPRTVQRNTVILVGTAVLTFILVSVLDGNYQERVNAVSFFLMLLGAYPAWLLLKGSERAERARRFLGISFLSISVLMLLRLLTGLSGIHVSQGLHEVSWVHSVFYLSVFVIFYALSIGFMLMARERLVHDLSLRATTDALTGAYNRYAFEPIAETALAQIDRRKLPVSLLMIDLDHFKKVNDRHGHLVGDEVLRVVTQLMRRELRAGDVLARYGGEELSLLLPDTDATAARQIGERLRFLIETTVLPGQREPVRLTASFGLTTTWHSVSLHDVIQAADLALYQAKTNGRNQLCECPVVTEFTGDAAGASATGTN